MTQIRRPTERIERATRLIGQSNAVIQRRVGWAWANGEPLSDEDRQDIIDSANDIQTQVEKILKEITK